MGVAVQIAYTVSGLAVGFIVGLTGVGGGSLMTPLLVLVFGINPATDNVAQVIRLVTMMAEVIEHYGIPTQSCVLTHVTNTLLAIEQGAPVDLVFQSVAGTERANAGFGINLALLHEAREAALSLKRGTVGDNVMYFETGQGSALSALAAPVAGVWCRSVVPTSLPTVSRLPP